MTVLAQLTSTWGGPLRQNAGTANHYQTLGVRTGASREEVRRAYRDLARRLHPDRHGQASAAERALADRRMREVNRAWQVLNDEDQRRRYDDSLRPAASSVAAGQTRLRRPVEAPPPVTADDDDLVDVMGEVGPVGALLMRHLPWLVAAVVLVGILVASAYATGTRPASGPTSTRTAAQSVGACLVVTPGPVTRTVTCTTPGALRLVARVRTDQACPVGAEPRRLDSGGFTDCLAAPSAAITALTGPSAPSGP